MALPSVQLDTLAGWLFLFVFAGFLEDGAKKVVMMMTLMMAMMVMGDTGTADLGLVCPGPGSFMRPPKRPYSKAGIPSEDDEGERYTSSSGSVSQHLNRH